MSPAIVARVQRGDQGPKHDKGPGRRRHPKMVMHTDNGNHRLVVPYAPREVEQANLAGDWVEIERPGRSPILSRASDPLKTLGFELFLGQPAPNKSAGAEMQLLKKLADSPSPIVVRFSAAEAGLWRITDLTISSVHRREGDNAITRATANLTLTRASNYKAALGPATGGAAGGGGEGGGRTYQVKKGDTLHTIAAKFYDDHSKWRVIADANKIKHSRNDVKLNPGKELRIPRLRKRGDSGGGGGGGGGGNRGG